MKDRSAITGIRRPARAKVEEKKPVRRRRTVRPKVEEGDIVPIRNGEDLALLLLRSCPREMSAFRHGPLHVSDLLGKCMRKMALSEYLHKPMPAQQLGDSMGLTFAQGVAIHDYVKTKFMQGHPDKLYGRWSCLCGKTVTEERLQHKKEAPVCPECNTQVNRYKEIDIHDAELDIVGSPDVVLYLADYGVYYPIELKSITYDDWKEMVRPKPDHVLQILFYWFRWYWRVNVPNQ